MRIKKLYKAIYFLTIPIFLCSCKSETASNNMSGNSEQQEVSQNNANLNANNETVFIDEPPSIEYVYEDEEIKLCKYSQLQVHAPDASDYEVPQEVIDEQLDILIDGIENAKNVTYDGTDEWFLQNAGQSKAEIEKQLSTDAKDAYPAQLIAREKNELITYIYNHSEFNPSKERYEIITSRLKHECRLAADEYGWDDMEQMLSYRYGYKSWDEYIDSKEGQEAINTNARMDLLFDTLWKEIGLDELYEEDISDLNKLILEDPENADYEEIKSQKQQMQSIITDYIYDSAVIDEKDEGEVQK